MALISESNLKTLTDYLGNSHNQLYSGLGNSVDDIDSSKNYMARGKVFIRGGSDTDGVDISEGTSSCLVSPTTPNSNQVTIPSWSRWYINGTVIETSSELTYDFNNEDSVPEGLGTSQAYRATLYVDSNQTIGAVKTPKFVYHSYADYSDINYPSVPDGTIEIGRVLVRHQDGVDPIIASSDITDSRQISGYRGLEDDDQMVMFTSFNSDENKLIATTLNFSSYFTSSVSAVVSHVNSTKSVSGTFEYYYQYRDFEFSQYFRKLYYMVRSTELSQRMGFLTFTGPGAVDSSESDPLMGDARKLNTAAQFEVYVPRYQYDGSSAYSPIVTTSSVGFDVYLVKNITAALGEDMEASYDVVTIDADDTSSFSSSGYLLIDSEVMSYSSSTDTSFTISARGLGTIGSNPTAHYADADIYQVEKKSVSITDSTLIEAYNDSVAIATSSDTYIQCAAIDNISGGANGVLLGIRNKVI